MKVWLCVAVGMLASIACGADEPLRPVPLSGHSQTPEISPEVRKRILQQKTAELRQLQEEILKLNGSISHPTRIRTTIRAIAIDGVKLKKQKLSDPFQADDADADGLATAKHVTFDNDAAVLSALEPLVASGCAKVLANPTLITAVGETSILNCYRELPQTEESVAESKIIEIMERTTHVPGYRAMVRAVVDSEGELLVTAGCRISIEDPAAAVKLNGQVKLGISSRAWQGTYKVRSGAPSIVSLGTMKSAVAKTDGKRWSVVPAGLKPKAADTGDVTDKIYFQITSERLPESEPHSATSRLR